jgi:pimeloyl-ACP methyl ester carboxylesterase
MDQSAQRVSEVSGERSPGRAALADDAGFVDIDWDGRRWQIECQRVGQDRDGLAPLVFLHEGLGSVSMWRDFPWRLCAALGRSGFVYSRPGYGRSSPRPAGQPWGMDFMHREALEVLPKVLEAAGLSPDGPAPWLVGHSDGGSIALIHAARFPERVAGLVAIAPHILVEDICVGSIAHAVEQYRGTDWPARLARHHDDPDGVFSGWSGIWLDPAFRDWTIESELGTIRCPVLAVQGLDDAYGTLEQVRGIARRLPGTRVIELAACGHSPHRDQADPLIAAVTSFIQQQPRHTGD